MLPHSGLVYIFFSDVSHWSFSAVLVIKSKVSWICETLCEQSDFFGVFFSNDKSDGYIRHNAPHSFLLF